jgi:hypothetical protein
MVDALKVASDVRRGGGVAHEQPKDELRAATREALRSRPRRRPRPRFLLRGMLEYRSVGVVRAYRIAPRVRGAESAFRADFALRQPRAEALGYNL